MHSKMAAAHYMLAGKGIVRAGSGKGITRAGSGKRTENCKSWFWERKCKSWLWERMGFLMPRHPLTNFEIQKYYQNVPKFNGVYSRNNLPKKIKGGAYIMNLDVYADVGTHWIALFCNRKEIVYFDSFGAEHIPEEIKEFIGNKNIKADIFRVQGNNSIMCVLLHWIFFILC